METFFTVHNLVTFLAFGVILLIVGIPLHYAWTTKEQDEDEEVEPSSKAPPRRR